MCAARKGWRWVRGSGGGPTPASSAMVATRTFPHVRGMRGRLPHPPGCGCQGWGRAAARGGRCCDRRRRPTWSPSSRLRYRCPCRAPCPAHRCGHRVGGDLPVRLHPVRGVPGRGRRVTSHGGCRRPTPVVVAGGVPGGPGSDTSPEIRVGPRRQPVAARPRRGAARGGLAPPRPVVSHAASRRRSGMRRPARCGDPVGTTGRPDGGAGGMGEAVSSPAPRRVTAVAGEPVFRPASPAGEVHRGRPR